MVKRRLEQASDFSFTFLVANSNAVFVIKKKEVAISLFSSKTIIVVHLADVKSQFDWWLFSHRSQPASYLRALRFIGLLPVYWSLPAAHLEDGHTWSGFISSPSFFLAVYSSQTSTRSHERQALFFPFLFCFPVYLLRRKRNFGRLLIHLLNSVRLSLFLKIFIFVFWFEFYSIYRPDLSDCNFYLNYLLVKIIKLWIFLVDVWLWKIERWARFGRPVISCLALLRDPRFWSLPDKWSEASYVGIELASAR